MNKMSERILCVPRRALPPEWLKSQASLKVHEDVFFRVLAGALPEFLERGDAEEDEKFKQIIPYVLVQDGRGRLVCYPRQGSEARLHRLWSVGVGGHVNPGDGGTFREWIANGARRELEEELPGLRNTGYHPTFLGVVNEDGTPVGRVHLGAVYLARVGNGVELEGSEELRGFRWLTLDEAARLPLEKWSRLAMDLLK